MDAINHGQVFILILSARSNTSHQVFREVERAASKGKTLITLFVEKLEVSRNLEFLISLQNWLDAAEPPMEKHLDYLAKAVHILRKGAGPENPDEVEPEPQAGQRPGEINIGPFVPKLCDRSSQVHSFVNTFIANLKRYPKRPRVYFIHGEEGECADAQSVQLRRVSAGGPSDAQKAAGRVLSAGYKRDRFGHNRRARLSELSL